MTKRRHLFLLFLVLVSALSGYGEKKESPPSSWDIVTIDSQGTIAVDSKGKAHIAYFVDDKDAGSFTGIDVDSHDNVHMAYYPWDGSRGRLKYARKESSPEPPAPVTPKLGISVLPKGQMSEWNDDSFTNAFQKAGEGGFTIAVWRHPWGELEPTLGSYQWDNLDYEVWKTEQQGMEYSLVVEIIHTNSLGQYPTGISFITFDDPAFVESLGRFIRTLLHRYLGKIHYLWLGNEVDFYLHEHPDQITPFVNLYREIKGQIKSIDSDIVGGIVGAYHLARSDGEIPMLQMFAEEGDAIALTLYMEDDDAIPEVSETQSYFEELMQNFSGTQVAIIETSWSSEGPRGGEQKQVDYVRELAQVLKTHRERFLFFSWFILYDLPQDLNRQIAASFGVCPEQPPDPPWCTEFLSWQGSLAMLRNDGSDKPAWGVWKEHVAMPTEVEQENFEIPKVFNLFQNYPNPFNPGTSIQYQLPRVEYVTIKIFNVMAQEVQTLVDEVQPPGVYKIEWDGKNRQGQRVSTGWYIIRMEAGEFTKSKKILLLK